MISKLGDLCKVVGLFDVASSACVAARPDMPRRLIIKAVNMRRCTLH